MSFPTRFEAFEEAEIYEGYTNDGEVLVEVDGFATTKELVEEMLYAGERLSAWRVEQYDYEGEEGEDLDSIPPDPSASPNFDMVDADEIIERANLKYQEYVRRVVDESKPERASSAGEQEAGVSSASVEVETPKA